VPAASFHRILRNCNTAQFKVPSVHFAARGLQLPSHGGDRLVLSHDTPRHRPCCLLVDPNRLLHPQPDHPNPAGALGQLAYFVPSPTADVTASEPTAQAVIGCVILDSSTISIVIAYVTPCLSSPRASQQPRSSSVTSSLTLRQSPSSSPTSLRAYHHHRESISSDRHLPRHPRHLRQRLAPSTTAA